MRHIGNLQKYFVTKKRNATVKNCFILNHFNPKAQLIFTWTGNQLYQKYFVVVSQTGIRQFA